MKKYLPNDTKFKLYKINEFGGSNAYTYVFK